MAGSRGDDFVEPIENDGNAIQPGSIIDPEIEGSDCARNPFSTKNHAPDPPG
jgi:hypothetical protein